MNDGFSKANADIRDAITALNRTTSRAAALGMKVELSLKTSSYLGRPDQHVVTYEAWAPIENAARAEQTSEPEEAGDPRSLRRRLAGSVL